MTSYLAKQVFKIMMSPGNTDLVDVIEILDQILFEKNLFTSPFDQQEDIPSSFIIFLFNKLIFTAGHEINSRVRKQYLLLQKKLMNFCYQHKPTLFDRLLNDYIQSLRTLIEFKCKSNCDFQKMNTFTCTDTRFVTEIDENFEFGSAILPLQMIDPTIQCLIEVLNYTIDIAFHFHMHLHLEILERLLIAYQSLDCCTKLRAINYGIRLFDNVLEHYNFVDVFYMELFQNCNNVWQNLLDWINLGSLDEYAHLQLTSISLDMFRCNYKHFLINETDAGILMGLAMSTESIMMCVIKNQKRFGHKTELKSNILDYIIFLHDQTEVLLLDQNLIQLVQSEKQIVKLFGIVLENGNITIQSQVLEGVRDILIKELMSEETDYETVKLVLNTIAAYKHKALSVEQFKAYKASKDVREISQIQLSNISPFKWEGLHEAVSIFVRSKDLHTLSFYDARECIEISGMLLRKESPVGCLPPRVNARLIETMFFYLKSFSTKTSAEREVILENQIISTALDALANVEHRRLDSKTKSYFMKLIGGLFTRRNDDFIKMKLIDMVLEFLANDILSMKHIVDYILPVMVGHNEFVISYEIPGLKPGYLAKVKAICCSALACVYIFKYRCENGSKYVFLCQECDKPNDEVFKYFYQKKSAVLIKHTSDGRQFKESTFSFVLSAIGSNALFSDRNGIFAVNHFLPAKIEHQLLENSCLIPELVDSFVANVSLWKISVFAENRWCGVENSSNIDENNHRRSYTILELISVLGCVSGIPEQWVFNFFKMTFFFLIGTLIGCRVNENGKLALDSRICVSILTNV